MIASQGQPYRHCDGVSRQLTLAGGLGAFGLTLADLLRSNAMSAPKTRTKSVIKVVLSGGVSHIDGWDPKPDAAAENRG